MSASRSFRIALTLCTVGVACTQPSGLDEVGTMDPMRSASMGGPRNWYPHKESTEQVGELDLLTTIPDGALEVEQSPFAVGNLMFGAATTPLRFATPTFASQTDVSGTRTFQVDFLQPAVVADPGEGFLYARVLTGDGSQC